MYNAFISYSHAADDNFAPALQNALQKFAKPWYKKRNLEIFRDESSLEASPHLWENITKALDQSEYLILLASPISENSHWVNKEIEYWLEHKSIDTILIALTGGNMEWDNQNNCFLNPDNNSLPPALDDKFTDEPFYIDLRQSKTEKDLSLDNPIFKKEVLKLAAKLHRMAPNDLASEEVSVFRKMILVRNGAISILGLMLCTAIILAIVANVQRKNAIIEKNNAQSLLLASYAEEQLDKNPTLAIRLAQLAWHKYPSFPPALPVENIVFNGFYELLDSKCLFYRNNLLHKSGVNSAKFSPDGKRIVTATYDSIARIWDAESGLLLCTLMGNGLSFNSVDFSPDGKKIVTASFLSARIWDAETGDLIRTLNGHDSWVRIAEFSPDGKMIVTSSFATVSIWDAETGDSIRTLTGHNELVNSAKFSPDGKKIVTSSDDFTVRIWETETGDSLLKISSHHGHVNSADFSPNGKMIVTAFDDNTASIWDAETGMLLGTLVGHDSGIISGQFSTLEGFESRGRFFNSTEIPGIMNGVLSAEFSPDGKFIVTASEDHTSKIWDAETGKLLHTLKGNKAKVNSAEFSPNGKMIVTASEDSTVRIWMVETGMQLPTLEGHMSWVMSVGFSPDGKKIVTGSKDNTARIWDAETGKPLHVFEGDAQVWTAAFLNEGKIMTISGFYYGETSRIWDAETGMLLSTLQGNQGFIDSAEFSPDGKRKVTGSDDNTAMIWEVATGKLLHTLHGHKDKVNSAGFSPDGTRIVTASNDNTARIWLTTEGIIDWLGNQKNIYKLTNRDMEDLGIGFIDVEKNDN